MAEVTELRGKVLAMIAANSELPELEQLTRLEFILDVEEHSRLELAEQTTIAMASHTYTHHPELDTHHEYVCAAGAGRGPAERPGSLVPARPDQEPVLGRHAHKGKVPKGMYMYGCCALSHKTCKTLHTSGVSEQPRG